MGMRSELDRLIRAADEQKAALQRLRQLLDREEAMPPPEDRTAPRPEAEFKQGSQSWYKALARSPPKEANGLSMNSLLRSIRKPRPPRAPGQQTRKFNGLWWYF